MLKKYLSDNYVTIKGDQEVFGEKDFRKGIRIAGRRLYWDEGNDALVIEGAAYTTDWLSAKGVSKGSGGTGGASTLYQLADVLANDTEDGVEGAAAGKALVFDGTHWRAGDAGLNESQLYSYLTANKYLTQSAADSRYVTSSRKVIAGTGLSGGGALTSDVTLSLGTSGVVAGTYTKVMVDAYGRVTSGTNLSATDIPNLDWSKITTGKPTTLAGYGITDAYTKTEADGKYVTIATPQTITGQKTFTKNIAMNSGIGLSYSGNTVFRSTSGNTVISSYGDSGMLYFRPNGDTSDVGVVQINKQGHINGVSAGFKGGVSAARLSATEYVQIGDAYLKWDAANNAVYVIKKDDTTPVGFYSTDWLSAKGVSKGSGGTGGASTLYQLADVLANDTEDGVEGAAAGKALVFDGTHWRAGDAGLNESQLYSYLTANKYLTQSAADSRYVTSSRKVIAGTGLSGGGALTSDVTLSLGTSGVVAGTYTKVMVDAYGRVTSGTNLSATDIPNLDWSKITTGKPTTLAGYGITDAYTKTEADGKYVTIATPQTITGQKTFTKNIAMNSGIGLSYSGNTVFRSTSGNTVISSYGDSGMLYFRPNGDTSDVGVVQINKQGHINGVSAGFKGGVSAARLSATEYVQIGDAYLKWDAANNAVYVIKKDGTTPVGFYSTDWLSAKGVSMSGAQTGTLDSLNDVEITDPVNGQALKYDAASKKWVNGTIDSFNVNQMWAELKKADSSKVIDASHIPTSVLDGRWVKKAGDTMTGTLTSASSSGSIVFKGVENCDITNIYKDNGVIRNDDGGLTSIRNGLRFNWHDTYWYIGNLRGGNTESAGFGVVDHNNKLVLRVTPNDVRAPRFMSTVATGLSPLIVSSNTVVGNLNADLLDGLHEYSFLRHRDTYGIDGYNTLWAQIGIRQYNKAKPDGMANPIYNYGAVISLPGGNTRLDIWYNHTSSASDSPTNGIQYRSGFNDDKRPWRMLLDSVNYASYSDGRYVKKAGDTMTGDLNISGGHILYMLQTSSTSTQQIHFQGGRNDYGRIAFGGTAENAGWMEIASCDDGNEPIYARQYTDVFTTVKNTLTLLDANGDTVMSNNKGLSVGWGSRQVREGGSWVHGGADAANSDDANLRFGSWMGIGWYPTVSGQPVAQGKNAMWLNTRTGVLNVVGGIKESTICIGRVNSTGGYDTAYNGEINRYDHHLFLQHHSGKYLIMCTGGGLAGIGTNSPGEKLHVAGNTRTDGYFKSTVGSGTQPYQCSSTTLNSNLNADLFDNWHLNFLPRNYNNTRTYAVQFALGSTDNNWKKIFACSESGTGPWRSVTVWGQIWYAYGNRAQEEVRNYHFCAIFQMRSGETSSGSGVGNVVNSARLYLPTFAKEMDNIRLVRVGTNNFELQVRQIGSYHNGHIQYQYWANSANVSAWENLQSTSNTSVAVSAGGASTLADSRASSADVLTTSRTLWGRPFNGSSNIDGNIDNAAVITSKGGIRLDLKGSSGVAFYSGGSLCAVINNTGVGIGTSSPSQKLHVAGNIIATGAITAKASSSDIRLKTDIQGYDAMGIIRKFRSVKYHWNAIAKENSEVFNHDNWNYGLIAQDLLSGGYSQWVKDAFNDYYTIDYERLIPVVWKGLQEVDDEVTKLKREVARLNKRVKELEKSLCA